MILHYIKTFKKFIYHKLCVFRAGLSTKAPLMRLLLHDLSKFYPSEFKQYAKRYSANIIDEDGYLQCWVRHQNRNPHHWEYWVSRPKVPKHMFSEVNWKPAPMPMWAVREMVADWMGASKAYANMWPDPENWKWLENNVDEMILHPITVDRINKVLDELIILKYKNKLPKNKNNV